MSTGWSPSDSSTFVRLDVAVDHAAAVAVVQRLAMRATSSAARGHALQARGGGARGLHRRRLARVEGPGALAQAGQHLAQAGPGTRSITRKGALVLLERVHSHHAGMAEVRQRAAPR
jgi:hypothetical protein